MPPVKKKKKRSEEGDQDAARYFREVFFGQNVDFSLDANLLLFGRSPADKERLCCAKGHVELSAIGPEMVWSVTSRALDGKVK